MPCPTTEVLDSKLASDGSHSEKPRSVISVSYREAEGGLEGLAPVQPESVKVVSERSQIVNAWLKFSQPMDPVN